jgi:hypothetical protein
MGVPGSGIPHLVVRVGDSTLGPMLYTGILNRPETIVGVPVNITARHSSVFAPSWTLVRSVQPPNVARRDLTVNHPAWVAYQEDYFARMRLHYRRHKRAFLDLVEQAAREDVTILCLCHWASDANPVCHRFLLRDILGVIAQNRGLVIEPPLTEHVTPEQASFQQAAFSLT